MFGNTQLIHQQLRHAAHSAEQVRRQATQQFWQIHLWAKILQVWARLTRQPAHLLDLNQQQRTTSQTRHYAGIQTIPLHQIRGSEGRTRDFDTAFRPLQTHNQDRWIGLATAWQKGVTLPPVELVQVGNIYYVRDGHHRISVARARGQAAIEARVTVW